MERSPNAQQRLVIDELDNNILLYASAGTGKTFTVANRVVNILTQKRATPEEILCLTFTIKACNELTEDIQGYVGDEGKRVQVSTIHGFCYKVILEESKRQSNLYASVSVCDEVDQEEILKSILSSRFTAWTMEEGFQKLNLSPPDLSVCPLAFIEGEPVWLYGEYAITRSGEILPIEGKKLSPPILPCPHCGEECNVNDGKCAACNTPLTYSLQEKQFEIYNRRAALRNLVSELKHFREEKGLYSEDEVADYQRTFALLNEEKTAVYSGLISYYAKYVGATPDVDFEEATSRFIGRLVQEYDEHLRLSNLLDFDDLILRTNEIFQSEEGGARWSTAYKYIILDEMQDTSALEYKVLKQIFGQNKLMFCGDFFQTIYGWRGSKPLEILDAYAKEFSAKTFMLSENYRATKTLANASFGYLQNTYPALLGKFCPQALQIHSEEEGKQIYCYAYANREQEAWQIYKYLRKNRPQRGMDVCIIARTNKYIAELARYFQHFNEENEKDPVRFFTVEENFQFFKKPLVKDILATLKLLVNPFDRVSMERLTEKFVKNVGIKTIEGLRQYRKIGVCITDFLSDATYAYGDPYTPLLESLRKGNAVIYDVETTGLDLEKDEIIQLSAIKINAEGEILDVLDLMVEPTVPIDEEAYKTHGFDLAYIRAHGGLTAKEALQRFAAFAKDCVLVGHNNFAYDQRLLQRQFQDEGLLPPQTLGEYDTLALAKLFYPQLENYKLSTLCAHFEIVNECAHNALGDITATGKCLVQMVREALLPTALERATILAKYRDKFEKLYAFFKSLETRLNEGEELGEYIVDSLRLRNRYKTRNDFATMLDVIESLRTNRADRRAFLREYLKDAALSGSQMDVLIEKLNKIPIITVHQAKGCEFDTVILAGADDRNFPSYAAVQSVDEEEEKKVFYVAITRAKKKLVLTRALYNGRHASDETPYFWAIPEEYVRQNRAWKNGV